MASKLQIRTKCKEAHEDGTGNQEPVSPTGQYFSSKSLSICILAIFESEIPLDDSRATETLRDVLLPINPRFSSIMVYDKKGVKHWQPVEMNLKNHVKVPTMPSGLSLEAYDEHFDKYLTKLAMEQFPQDRPLWEVHAWKYPTTKAVAHVIFKFHHALGDGFSLMGALLTCLRRADDPSLPLTFPSTQSKSDSEVGSASIMGSIGFVPRVLSTIYNTACDYGWSVLKSSFVADDMTPIRSGEEGLESHPVQISTVALSIDSIKQIKTKLGVTINDVLTGIVFLGTRLYMHETGEGFGSSQSTALVLLNTRDISRIGYKSVEEMVKPDSEAKWGNQFAFLHIALPELMDNQSYDPLEFVYEAQKIIKRKKNSLAVLLTGQTLEISRKLRGPEAAARYVHSTLQKSSMTISNMIGPVEKVSLANHPCKGLYFMSVGVPQSITITIMSYMRTLRIGIGVQKGFIDSQKFNSCIKSAFELIYKTAVKDF